jgi:membrane-associated phospholipid phosphatase
VSPAISQYVSIRLTELTAGLRGVAPEATPVYAAVTALGGPTVATFLLAMLYWTTDRRRETATVLAYGFTGYAAVLALKAWLAIPRPPASAMLVAEAGYGFPSGHAAAATVVYGGLALEYGWRDGPRLAAVGVLVGAVSLTRVVLGVHYLGDVVAGVALGLAVLGGVRRLARGDPARSFAVGVGVSLPTLAVTGVAGEALGVLGACVGGLLAGLAFERVPGRRSRLEAALLVAVGVPLVLLFEAGAAAIPVGVLAASVDDFLVVAGVLLLPLVLLWSGLVARLEAMR